MISFVPIFNEYYIKPTGTNAYQLDFGFDPLLNNDIIFNTFYEGGLLWILIPNTNTGACTLTFNKIVSPITFPIKLTVATDLTGGELLAGGIYALAFDGTNFQLANFGGGSGSVLTPDMIDDYDAANDFQILSHVANVFKWRNGA